MSTEIWILFDKTNPFHTDGKIIDIFTTKELAESLKKMMKENNPTRRLEVKKWNVIDDTTPFRKVLDDQIRREIEEKKIF